jgi:hypothetical protein
VRTARKLLLLHKRATGAAASSLLTDLVSYWKLDETSGTRFDSVSANNLSDIDTVGFATGKIGNAAEFTGTNYLSTNTVLSSGPFSVSFWMNSDTVTRPSARIIARYGNGVPADQAWRASLRDDNAVITVGSTTLSIPNIASAATWHHFSFWYNDVAQEIGIQFDTTIQTTPQTTGYVNTNVDFTIGTLAGGPSSVSFRGLVDEVGVWSRVLTAAERTQLYNGGAGITYPFV